MVWKMTNATVGVPAGSRDQERGHIFCSHVKQTAKRCWWHMNRIRVHLNSVTTCRHHVKLICTQGFCIHALVTGFAFM
ncbi:hypothetical protein K1719_035197 [Acacia pycnantha]|nr:hypothetical protein K1719_035197 [Acacia pycnantha]